MTIKVGLNIHPALQGTNGKPRAYSDAEKKKRDSIIDRLQSTGNLWMDDLDAARESKKRHPNQIVVHRAWRPNDGDLFKDMSPQQFYETYARHGEGGLVVQVMNEPTGYGQQNSPEDLEKIADWCAAVMDKFGAIGHALALPNFGEGHPHEVRLLELGTFWQALKKWKDLHYYASHEYGTWRGMTYDDPADKADVYPWRIGRFTFIADHCSHVHGFIPNMLITEWGIDSAHDGREFRGWRTTARTPRQYAKELIACLKSVYHFAYVKALMVYCMGNTGERHTEHDWWSFDVWGADEFFDTLEAESLVVVPPPTPPVPEPAPIPIPTPLQPAPPATDARYEKRIARTSGLIVKVYTFARLDTDVVTKIDDGVEVGVILSMQTADGWLPVSVRGFTGWVMADRLLFVKPNAPPVEEPPDEDKPTPDAEIVKLVAELVAAINRQSEAIVRLAAALEKQSQIEESYLVKPASN